MTATVESGPSRIAEPAWPWRGLRLALAALLAAPGADSLAARAPPLMNPAMLNIGLVCRWEAGCMKRQNRAMEQALRYVRRFDPAPAKIQQCNRNASRRHGRVDWIGYNNCIRNLSLAAQRRSAQRRR